MSLVVLRVELPAHSHSFTVQAPAAGTVADVKEVIQATCTGQPRTTGQRLIWRGRALRDDERLQDIWQPHEAKTVHLAVHPTAWTDRPPTTPAAAVSTSPVLPTPSHSMEQPQNVARPSEVVSVRDTIQERGPAYPPSTPRSHPVIDPLAFVRAQQEMALKALTQDTTPLPLELVDAPKAPSVQFVEGLGWKWPAALDSQFPPSQPGGVKYSHTTIDGQLYLKLEDHSEPSTPSQKHALRVLSHTLEILKAAPVTAAPVATTVAPWQSPAVPPEISALLQQLGIQDLQPNVNVQQDAQIPIIVPIPNLPAAAPQPQFRPLLNLLPVTFIILRIALLLYFFAPARKPVMGLLLVGWGLYEIWTRHVRVAANPAVPAQRPVAAAPAGNGAAAPDVNQNNAQPVGEGAQANNLPGLPRASVAPVETFATVNLSAEEQMLEGNATGQPTILKKAALFGMLFLSTIHPAIWDRRRALLRQREGRIRTEATAMRAPDDGTDSVENQQRTERRAELLRRHGQRPSWVQSYVQRVMDEDWVDDS
ncbi:hypothetical protein CYLTODRAFT_485249 [Cylindrobasidium torrendii FP15055 ss-10]|uniref:Ubiquitin-like domain-containing protein n=1 Tax=Cylindrobasidium torrendii FP15055 ss-10 TaxID=1314674 RepID=A0A0D7BTA1_9AGAR|nr:hypothetical protein CYLTODRAFT_485249 [Cylindrobasidium torrendii FP15055 ss-10]